MSEEAVESPLSIISSGSRFSLNSTKGKYTRLPCSWDCCDAKCSGFFLVYGLKSEGEGARPAFANCSQAKKYKDEDQSFDDDDAEDRVCNLRTMMSKYESVCPASKCEKKFIKKVAFILNIIL